MITRFRNSMLWMLLAIIALVVILLVYAAWSKRLSIERKRAAFSKLEAVGVPLASADRRAFLQLPAEVVDSTDEWTTVFAQFREVRNRVYREHDPETLYKLPFVGIHDKNGRMIPPPWTEWEQERQVTEYLQHFQDVIGQCHRLARAGGAWRYISTNDLAEDEGHPLAVGYRSLGETLLLNSHFQARNGHPEIAFDDLMDVLLIIEAGRFEAEFYSVMALQNLHRLISISAARLSVVCNWSDQQLTELQAALSKADFKARMKRAYIGEVSNNLTLLTTKPGSIADHYFAENLSHYAEEMLLVIQGYDKDWPAVFHSQHNFLNVLSDLQMQSNSRKRYAPLFVIAPATDRICDSTANAITTQRSGVAALARQRQFIATGKALDSIEQLGRESLPENFDNTDPFTGKPLKTTIGQQGFVIYGVGTDRVDNGGEILKKEDWDPGADIGVLHSWPTDENLGRVGVDFHQFENGTIDLSLMQFEDAMSCQFEIS